MKKKSTTGKPRNWPGIAEECWYERASGMYWLSDGKGGYLRLTALAARQALCQFRAEEFVDEEGKSGAAQAYLTAQMFCGGVIYAGPIAGYQPGRFETAAGSVLVTTPTRLPVPKFGSGEPLYSFFVDVYRGQSVHLFHWIKCAMESAVNGPPFRPSQALALVGGPGSGKSLTQTLITAMFGGGSGKAFAWLSGRSEFNGNLLSASHLVMEDDQSSTDPRARRALGTSIKGVVANHTHRIRRMHHEAFDVSPFWRLSVSLNDEPENILVLPEMDASLKDKITIIKANPRADLFREIEERGADRQFAQWIDAIPTFLHRVMRLSIPRKWQCPRYGVKAFHDPECMAVLNELSQHDQLWQLITGPMRAAMVDGTWSGTAKELEKEIRKVARPSELSLIFTWPSACGVLLSRLERQYPDHVQSKRHASRGRIYHLSIDMPLPADDVPF